MWFILIVNIFYSFLGNFPILLYIMTAFLFFMHGLFMLDFIGAFAGDKIEMSRWEGSIFGVPPPISGRTVI
ncbi:DUF1145 domain-containing protein [Vibrio splendidus]